MAKFEIKIIPEGTAAGKTIPLNIIYVDKKNIEASGLDQMQAIRAIATSVGGPCGINIFDMDAVTTTSDGIMVDGAIVCMAAADKGKIHPEFGVLHMAEIPYSEEIIKEEPHLLQWKKRYADKKLFRGPDPATKIIPIHNVVITGRASNNNSATEMMNIVTMEEIILPILGQVQCLAGKGDVLVGNVGEVISVGIGMTVAEKFGRIFPTRQFKAGQTAHGSGVYAKTLKKTIPCVTADKSVLAGYIINALEDGCVPAKEIGCSPAVLTIAKYLGTKIDFDSIASRAQEELDSVGITLEYIKEKTDHLTRDEIVARADELIPGVEDAQKCKASEIVETREISVE